MKGSYVISNTPVVKNHPDRYQKIVYPVPVKGAQNLGVHTTFLPSGYMKIGPSVSPAFAADNYYGMEKVTGSSVYDTVKAYMWMMAAGPAQRRMVKNFITQDLPKNFSIDRMVFEANKIQKVERQDFSKWYKPGIRPQLVDKNTGVLLTDFVSYGGMEQGSID